MEPRTEAGPIPGVFILTHTKPMGSHFGVGEFTTHFRTDFSGDWDVHWEYDLAFHPWPPDADSGFTPASKRFGRGEAHELSAGAMLRYSSSGESPEV